MSCVPILPMGYLLDALPSWPASPGVLAQIRALPEW